MTEGKTPDAYLRLYATMYPAFEISVKYDYNSTINCVPSSSPPPRPPPLPRLLSYINRYTYYPMLLLYHYKMCFLRAFCLRNDKLWVLRCLHLCSTNPPNTTQKFHQKNRTRLAVSREASTRSPASLPRACLDRPPHFPTMHARVHIFLLNCYLFAAPRLSLHPRASPSSHVRYCTYARCNLRQMTAHDTNKNSIQKTTTTVAAHNWHDRRHNGHITTITTTTTTTCARDYTQ